MIGGNGDSIYNRLMNAIERPDLVGPNYAHNHHRVDRQEEIEQAISSWTRKRTARQVVTAMNDAGVPVGRVLSVQDIVQEEQNVSRGAMQDVWVDGPNGLGDGWEVKMQSTFPVLDGVDPKPRWAGPNLGQHTDEVLKTDLHLDQQAIDELRTTGVIA